MTEWLLSYQLIDLTGQEPVSFFKDPSAASGNYSDGRDIMAKFVIYATGLVSSEKKNAFSPSLRPAEPRIQS